MSNITLIYHLDQEFINNKINEIKENLKIEDISIIKYTYDNKWKRMRMEWTCNK